MALGSLATLAACGLAAAAYTNGKLQLSQDLLDIRRRKQGELNFKRAIRTQASPCFELFKSNASKWATAEAVWSRDRSYTWKETLDAVYGYAAYFRAQDVQPHQFVAFYLTNSPSFMFAWMALLAIGAAPAMINYNLSGKALLRCISVSKAQFILVDPAEDCLKRFDEVRLQCINQGLKIVVLDDETISTIQSLPKDDNDSSNFQPNPHLALMYTSGSTGWPKAMCVGMQRAYCTASVQRKTFGQRPGPHGDRTYHCMPLYHGTGGLAALIDLMGGISIAVAPKFSVSRFWVDCIASKATVFLYVGEVIRYLIAASPSALDRKHCIRLIWGNGLRPDVWVRFQERFGVREIGEFFATTEGMLTLVNYSRNTLSRGAVGHHGWISRRRSDNVYVSVLVDPSTGDMYRDPSHGFAVRTPLEEGGEILIRVPAKTSWQGYYGAEKATESKFATDVLEPGDLFFRTGDALRRTREGYWFFIDRLGELFPTRLNAAYSSAGGDTYRWKGENISTTEVSEVVGSHPLVAEANVYGVEVPGHEGRAGCVALRLVRPMEDRTWCLDLATHLQAKLPNFAVPVFIRLITASNDITTGNYKHIKGPLQREGIDLSKRGSSVPNGHLHQFYWLGPSKDKFVKFTEGDFHVLCNGDIML